MDEIKIENAVDKKITILGAGIAGLATAISLKQKGFEPIIFEKASKINPVGAGLILATNAMLAFKHLGIMDEVIEKGELIFRLAILDQKGKSIIKKSLHTLSKDYGAGNYAIHRADLHNILLSKIDRNNLFLNKETIDIVRSSGDTVIVQFKDGTQHKTKQLIVAEGIHSPVRKKLLPKSTTRYAGYTCWRGIIDNPNLRLEGSSETWGKGRRFGIVPLSGNRIYWFACIKAQENDKTYRNYKIENLKREFNEYHSPISTILDHTKQTDLIWSDILDLKPIQSFVFGNIVLIGDAAHATTPNMGQGACQAIEDAVIIAVELEKAPNPFIAFKAFEERRIKRTQQIVKKSWTIGKIGQLENSLLTNIRNFIFRNLPSSVSKKQIESLYEVDF